MSSTVVTFLLSIIKERWPLTTQAILLAVITSVLEALSVLLTLPLLQTMVDGNAIVTLNLNIIPAHFVAYFSGLPSGWQVGLIITILLCITVIKNLTRYFSNYSINRLELQTGYRLREKCIDRILELELTYYSGSRSGELLSVINEQVQRSERLASSVLEIITEALTIATLSLLLVVLSPALTIIAVISFSVLLLLLKPIMHGIQLQGRRAANAIEEFTAVISEVILGIRIIKAFSSEPYEKARTEMMLQKRYRAELIASRYNSAVVPITETTGLTVIIILLGVGASILPNSSPTVLPMLFTYALALLRILPRVGHFGSLRSNFSLLSGSMENIQQFLNTTAGQKLLSGKHRFENLSAAISFNNVCFTYQGNAQQALTNIDLTIEAGKTTAIVGTSGSGKSTLVDMIMRFYDPSSGSITVDGCNLQDIDIASWRRSIAMVNQDTFLFHATIRENIAYSYLDATEAEIIDAAQKAYAYSFIQALPNGMDTIIGDRGAKLSGGQRQRIAIARAILRNPEILILDEATSALDIQSEQIVQQAIEEVSKGRTVIVIAHRLSTIEHADNIIVLRDGRIVEQESMPFDPFPALYVLESSSVLN